MPFDISEDQLVATEKEIGATLPSSYRVRMMQSNGGTVIAAGDHWELIPIRDTSNRKRLSRTANHLLRETEAFSKWRGWHENAYAVAQNGAGDALVVLLEGSGFRPEVFVWRHEVGELELAAEDFSQLRDA